MRDSPATEENVDPCRRALAFFVLATRPLAPCILQRPIVYCRVFAFGAALAALLVSIDSGAQEAAACKYEARLTEPNTVWIDSNTGAILSSATQFHTHRQRVDLYFVNKNPFGFTYTFDVKGTAIEEHVIRSALQEITGILSDEAEAKAMQASTAIATHTGQTAELRADCKPDDARPVIDAIEYVLAADVTLSDNLVSFNAYTENYNALVGKISPALPANEASCEALARNADDAIAIVNSADRSLQNVKESQEHLSNGITALKNAANTLSIKVLLPSEPKKCDALLKRARKEISETTARLKEIESVQKEIEARMEIIQANKQILEREFARSDAFVTQYPIGPVTEPMEYSIKIERTSRSTSARTTAAASAPIRLGQARFSFSGGIAFGFADQKNYVRQASVVNGEVKNIVGVDEESDTQVGVVGQLNGRLFGDNVSVLWSLGASLTQGAGDSQFGFFTGPTLGMIDDRLFISAGYHLRKEKRLSGGFSRGEEIPESLQGEIPTTEKTSGALLISVTYKLR